MACSGMKTVNFPKGIMVYIYKIQQEISAILLLDNISEVWYNDKAVEREKREAAERPHGRAGVGAWNKGSGAEVWKNF